MLTALVAATGWAGFTNVAVWVEGNTNLVDGFIYRNTQNTSVGKDLTNTTATSYCPMHLTNGVTTVLWIDRNTTLGLYGGHGTNAVSSCPAIQFDSPNATLIIAGHGTLEVTGGDGGNGTDGAQGGECEKGSGSHPEMKGGSGGKGGNGGGAASPGIGGRAGNGGGGAPTRGTSYEKCYKEGTAWNRKTEAGNKNGTDGTKGCDGTGCGTIYVIGTVTVRAAHGSGGKRGVEGEGGNANDTYYDTSSGDDYFVGPGGGGGAGAGGPQPAAAIGGGAGGGGGGGSGATGTTIVTEDYNNGGRYKGFPVKAWQIGGYGGGGGRSDRVERTGADGGYGKSLDIVRQYWHSDTINLTHEDEGDKRGSRSPYPGGAGGKKGADGDNGKLYIMSSARVQNIVTGQSAYAQAAAVSLNETALAKSEYAALPDGVKYTLYLRNSGTETIARTVALGCKYPSVTIPSREHYIFKGYYERPNRGGACYYDASGRWMLSDDDRYYDRFSDQTLYAAWELDAEASDTVEVKSGETLVVDELTGASEYVQSTDKPLFTVRRGGKLILNNLTFLGSETSTAGIIRNFGEVVVSNCSFTSCFSRKGRGGVYRDFAGAQAAFIRCSFVSCGAQEGGTIAAEGSKISVLASTFAFNGSLADISVHPCLGAAIYSDLKAEVHVCNCTFAGQVAAAGTGSVITYCSEANSETPKGCVVNCAFDMDASCPLSITNRPETCEYNFRTVTSASADAAGDWCKTVDGTLTLAPARAINGVPQTFFKVSNELRTRGIAERFYPTANWPYYIRKSDGTGEPLRDILEEWPITGYVGSRSGNELQRLIDMTPAGGRLVVPPRTYDGVIIDKMITIVGEDLASTIVSGDGFEPCVTYLADGENATWINFTFANGKNAGGAGGGWTSEGGYCGIASNCLFRACTALDGGGAAHAKLIADSVFIGCTADDCGGGTYSCAEVHRTYYLGNAATVAGGGAYGDERTYAALFQQNDADSGGGVSDGDCSFCTFAKNTSASESLAGAAASRVLGCVFYGHPVPTDDASSVVDSRQLYASDFVDAKSSGGAADFHLALRDYQDEKLTHDNVRLGDVSPGLGLLDFDKMPLVSIHPITGEKYLYAGCYAFSPFKTSGLTVTGSEESYPNSNVQSSLREAIESAAEAAPMTNGQLVVGFSPKLFEYESTVCFPLSSVQIDLCAFTNATLVLRGPTNHVAVLDGTKTSRAFRVFPQNRVVFENLVFQNCFGDIYGKSPQPGCNGGAVLNYGTAFFSNCVFRANRAGNRYAVPNDQAPVGFGGALSTEAGGTSTVYAVTFAGNRAAKGGAVWTADGGSSRVYYSTFAGNIADGDVVTDATGGACAQERKTSGAKGSQLWLVNCTLAGNRVTKAAESGGAVSGAKKGLVLLNSIVIGNYAANATNDIAMPAGSTAQFYYTAYGTRTVSPKTAVDSMRIAYDDCCATGGVAYLDALAYTNGEPAVEIALPQPQSVLPLAVNFKAPATYAWTTEDYSTLGYGSADWVEEALDGGDVFDLLLNGSVRTVNQVGQDQAASGYMMLGPVTVTANSLRQDDPSGGGETPVYDDEDQVAETNGVCRITRIDGSPAYYLSVTDAKKHWRAGDTVTIVNQTNAEDQVVLAKELTNAFYRELLSFAKTHEWYDFTYDKTTLAEYALSLNEKATPAVRGEFDTTSSKDRVSVQITNVKPNLWYALGHAAAPEGPYACEKWVQADDNGGLKDFLTAPKSGASGFYRVFVAPYVK